MSKVVIDMATTLQPATESDRMQVSSSQWPAQAIHCQGDEHTWITSYGWVWSESDEGSPWLESARWWAWTSWRSATLTAFDSAVPVTPWVLLATRTMMPSWHTIWRGSSSPTPSMSTRPWQSRRCRRDDMRRRGQRRLNRLLVGWESFAHVRRPGRPQSLLCNNR